MLAFGHATTSSDSSVPLLLLSSNSVVYRSSHQLSVGSFETSEGQALEASHVEGTHLLRGSRRFFVTAAA